MKVNVGIDLGTTYSAVSLFDAATGESRILKNSLGADYTPSVVYINNGQVTIGEDAKALQAIGDPNTAAFYKTFMGDKYFSMYLDGENYTSEDLSAMFLKALKKDIEDTNNVTIDGAVITVPAYFNEAQRQATINAGQKAGMKVLKIINEPTAAIIAYGLTGAGKRKAMVYDLGGGTFDVTLADIDGQQVTVRGTNGDHQLGGKDWDARLVAYLAEQFENEHGITIAEYPEDYTELQVECENIKKKLSSFEKVTASVQCDGRIGRYEVSRELFNELTSDLLAKTQLLIEECFNQVGEDYGWKTVDEIVLVGGSTRMPQVKDLIVREHGKPPITSVNVDTVVSKGASIQAALCTQDTIQIAFAKPAANTGAGTGAQKRVFTLGKSSIKDVTSHGLGLLSTSEDNQRYINSIIIPKNEQVPSTHCRPFKVRSRSKDMFIDAYILQGESDIPSDNHILGKYVIEDIEPQSDKEIIVDISYTYNENGMVDVTAKQRKTGKDLRVTKHEVPDDMSWIDMPPKLEAEKTSSKIYLAIDASGSMCSSFAKVKQAAYEFCNDIDLSCSQIGVVAFADREAMACAPCQNMMHIQKAIDDVVAFKFDIGAATNGHPLTYIRKNFGEMEDRNYVVVLTDGVWFQPKPEIESARELKNMGIEVVALGFADADTAFLRSIASSDAAALKTDLNSLKESFSSIAQAITEGDDTITIRRR